MQWWRRRLRREIFWRKMRRKKHDFVHRCFAKEKVVHIKNAKNVKKKNWRRIALNAIADGAEANAENGTLSLCGNNYYVSVIMREAPIDSVPRLVQGLHNAPHAWLFVGKNSSDTDLPGRPEHTDALAKHIQGTWHWQAQGCKRWYIAARGHKSKSFLCEPGDLLLIDTSFWSHRTSIPPQSDISVSIARDFSQNQSEEHAPTNIDATLAARRLYPGDIVLTQDDLPDCSLPRSPSPNCKVDICPDTGRMLLRAITTLVPGDVLTVLNSSDEASSSSSE
mmetsp:Transcript_8126/g.11317  ORF Transcript_8126/g.11317 Transcript_8126/m.11317 type:complete len:279 (+) Transcript_8126:51-887(+)